VLDDVEDNIDQRVNDLPKDEELIINEVFPDLTCLRFDRINLIVSQDKH